MASCSIHEATERKNALHALFARCLEGGVEGLREGAGRLLEQHGTVLARLQRMERERAAILRSAHNLPQATHAAL